MVASIIVATCNRAASLAETLQSMASLRVPENLPTELIVVDNGSKDGTTELLRVTRFANLTFRHVLEPKPGKANALNAGIAAARGEVLLFTDDDVRVPVDWVQRMSAQILTGAADAVAGGVRMAPHLERSWMTPIQKAWLASTDVMTGERPGTFVGANMAISRTVLARVPGFDPDLGPGALGFCEDALLCLQVNQAGFRSVFALDVIVEHHFDRSRLTRRSFLSRAEKEGRSSAYLADHWLHEHITFPRLRLAKHAAQLALLRALRFRECRAAEGLPEWEMFLVKDVAFYEQHLLQRNQKERNYTRLGLVRRKATAMEVAYS